MAGADYLSCDVCGCKTIYDAEVNYEYANCRDIAALCKDCEKTHRIVIQIKSTDEDIGREKADFWE